MAYNIYYNNKSNRDLGIEVVKRPYIPFPEKNIKSIDIPGRDGSYYVDNGSYNDMVISIDFNFVEDRVDDIRERIREIKHYFEDKIDNRLFLSDNLDTFFRVRKVELDNISYEDFYEIQQFTVDFTVEAYEYTLNGQNEIRATNEIFNQFDISKPTYRIVGNGTCYLTINGNKIKCIVNKELTIDTDNDKILDSNKELTIGKTNIKEMKDLYLQSGKNTLSITNNFVLYVKTNFRTI